MPLARLAAPFDHPEWIFEPKLDGFRALAHIEGGHCQLISRNRNLFKTFSVLAAGIASAIPHDAVIDGEIVYVGPDGRPQFYELMRRRGPQHFYAFDILCLDGHDLRGRPLLERKRLLREIVPPQPSPLLYLDHVASYGVDLFRAACEQDLEGIVAKLASGRYTPEETTWVKIKNSAYTQAEGRHDFFDSRTARRTSISERL
jgi:bifunctional non-homologous end joining protein LigD